MSRRQIVKKYPLFSQVDTTSTQTSSETDVQQVDFITYQFTLDISVNVIIEIQYCNDERISASSVFKPLDFEQTINLVGSSHTDGLIHIENRGFKFIRVKSTNNGGAGNISCWVTGVGRGA